MTTRRSIITGLSAFIAAPAIIRVAGIMPIRAVRYDVEFDDEFYDIICNFWPQYASSWPQTPGEFWPPVRGSTNWEPGVPIQSLLPNQQHAAIMRPVRIC